jgi:UDP-2,3-diacylglucosamine pyrophosphatase LpxH
VKQKVKSAVNYISDFEHTLAEFARARKYDGIICGHIHHPEDRTVDGIHYLNSGDWVETLSALTEDGEGRWRVVYYTEAMKLKKEKESVLSIIPVAS